MKSICKAVISVYVKVYVPFTFFPFPFTCNSSTFGHVNLFKTNSNIIFMERSLFKFALLGVMLLISHSSFFTNNGTGTSCGMETISERCPLYGSLPADEGKCTFIRYMGR